MGDGSGATDPDHAGTSTRPPLPISRTQRRVLQTRAAIENAFVALVLEHGYDKVTVEEIVAKADLAKATFYAHYENKEALMSAVFSRLVKEGAERMAYREGPWTEVRGGAVQAAYELADDMRDLYKVCLGDPRARSSYVDTVTQYAEQNFVDRLNAIGRQPQVPVRMMARAFAGAHVVILESWLDGEIPGTAQEVAAMQLDLLVAGMAWGHNISSVDLGYTVDPEPLERRTRHANPSSPKPARTSGAPKSDRR
jgi:AcrR family transcriptional regulator